MFSSLGSVGRLLAPEASDLATTLADTLGPAGRKPINPLRVLSVPDTCRIR